MGRPSRTRSEETLQACPPSDGRTEQKASSPGLATRSSPLAIISTTAIPLTRTIAASFPAVRGCFPAIVSDLGPEANPSG